MSNKKRAKFALERMTDFDLRLIRRIADGDIVELYYHPEYEDSIEWLEDFELILKDGDRWAVSLAGQRVIEASSAKPA